MNLTLFGATGALGSECLQQALAAGHEVTVLVREATRLPDDLRPRLSSTESWSENSSRYVR